MPNRLQRQIILEAIDEPHKLSDKDNEFIQSIAELEDDQKLTSPQNTWLNDIGTRLARKSREY